MTIQENKELIRRVIEEIWNGHDLEKARAYLGGDQIDESIEHVRQFLTAFPDAQVTIEDLIADGDKVVARLLISGTNTGPFAGQPPSGKQVQFRSFRIYQIAGGKIIDTWAMQDRLGLMEQLGLVQSAGGNVNWAAGEED